MDEMRVLFVGVGSIARRHIKNISEALSERGKKSCIDAFRTKKHGGLPEDISGLIQNVYDDFELVPDDYHIVFITNPTEFHLDTLKKFHNKGRHFFIEKPLCTYEQLASAPVDYLRENSVYYVASPLRYTKVLQYVKQNIDMNEVYSARAISSSYLPNWRPGTDYRTTYSAHKELGGGVAIDLIHEWDYLTYLFGKPEKVHSIMKKVSHLEIDTEDVAIYIGEYEDKVVELHLDYFGQKTIRQLELFMKNDTVICDLVNSTVAYQKSGEVIEFGEERNAFQKEEIQQFLNLIEGKCFSHNKFFEAYDVLKLTGGN